MILSNLSVLRKCHPMVTLNLKEEKRLVALHEIQRPELASTGFFEESPITILLIGEASA